MSKAYFDFETIKGAKALREDFRAYDTKDLNLSPTVTIKADTQTYTKALMKLVRGLRYSDYVGYIAKCTKGNLGYITRTKVVNRNGVKKRVYIGIHLDSKKFGKPWQSVDPIIMDGRFSVDFENGRLYGTKNSLREKK